MNPEVPPPPPTPPESPARTPEPTTAASPPAYRLVEIGKKGATPWSLSIYPAHLALSDSPGAQPYVVLRDQMMKSVVFMPGMRALMLQQPRKVTLKLTPAGANAVEEWIGKPFLASFYMNRRYKMLVPWAIVWLLASALPLLPNPNRHTQPHFDFVGFALGAILLATFGIAKWRPHPVLFLVDALWFAIVAVRLTMNVVLHDRSKGWFVLVAVMIWAAVTGVQHFIRFRTTRIAPLPS